MKIYGSKDKIYCSDFKRRVEIRNKESKREAIIASPSNFPIFFIIKNGCFVLVIKQQGIGFKLKQITVFIPDFLVTKVMENIFRFDRGGQSFPEQRC